MSGNPVGAIDKISKTQGMFLSQNRLMILLNRGKFIERKRTEKRKKRIHK